MSDYQNLRKSVFDISSHTKQVVSSKLATAVNNKDIRIEASELPRVLGLLNALVDEAFFQAVQGVNREITNLEQKSEVDFAKKLNGQ